MAHRMLINKSEFLRLYDEGKTDHEIAAIFNVSHDKIYRLRRKLIKSGILPPRTRRTPESKVTHETKASDVVLSACSAVEIMLKGKDERYVKGFEDGAKWRLELSNARGRTL